MRRVRSLHGTLTYLFGVLVVVQVVLAGLGTFTSVHNKRFDDNNLAAHGILGTVLVVFSLR